MRNLNRSGELQKIISDEKLPIKLATLDVDDDASVSDAFNKVFAEHGDSWRLRYLVGADAEALVKWRSGITDEELVAIQTESDAEFVARMKKIYGLDVSL
jgi:hypothetical protein